MQGEPVKKQTVYYVGHPVTFMDKCVCAVLTRYGDCKIVMNTSQVPTGGVVFLSDGAVSSKDDRIHAYANTPEYVPFLGMAYKIVVGDRVGCMPYFVVLVARKQLGMWLSVYEANIYGWLVEKWYPLCSLDVLDAIQEQDMIVYISQKAKSALRVVHNQKICLQHMRSYWDSVLSESRTVVVCTASGAKVVSVVSGDIQLEYWRYALVGTKKFETVRCVLGTAAMRYCNADAIIVRGTCADGEVPESFIPENALVTRFVGTTFHCVIRSMADLESMFAYSE